MANEARFTGLAAAYERGRPDYPDAAFMAMVEGLPRPLRAADIGCGTGISTRRLAMHADEVIGIDPNCDMLDSARRRSSDARSGGQAEGESAAAAEASADAVSGGADCCPAPRAPRPAASCAFRRPAPIRWELAPAEDTGLERESIGLVLVAQAFHWFDAERALEEFRRVLVPGGRVALLWNLRDDRDTVTAAYSAITVPEAKRRLDATSLAARNETGRPLSRSRLFCGYRRLELRNEQRLDLAGLLDRAGSASYYPREGPDRAAADAKLRALFETHARAGKLSLQYRVELHLAERA